MSHQSQRNEPRQDTTGFAEGAAAHEPVAVVGLGALFPGSKEPTGFWRSIVEGQDLIEEVPAHYWLVEDFYDPDPFAPDKTYGKRGAFLSKIDFDPMAFGIPPKNVPHTDTSQLLALLVAKQVLDDLAQGPFREEEKERMSCILGVASGLELLGEMSTRLQRPILVKVMREMGLPEDVVQEICDRSVGHGHAWSEATFPGLLGNVVAGRVANRFDLGGMNCTTDAACASSFSALSLALDELWLGHSDVVITGGVDTTQDPFMYMCFSKTPALSLTGDARPFSDQADGTILGEGLGMVALKRLSDAERDGNHVYAVIRSIGASSDGRAKSIYAPLPRGQARALDRAYRLAGVSPATVEMVEAHGTATNAGDKAEVEGLRQAFDPTRKDTQWCALGSIKSQVGHTKSAAGVASLLKAVYALQHRVLPPTLKVERPNPELGLHESAFYLNTQTRPWVRGSGHPRRAGVSSFGFGGTNYHCVLEEYRGSAPAAKRRRVSPTELVLLGAESPAALLPKVQALASDLESTPGLLRFVARDSQRGFDASWSARLAVVASSDEDLRAKLLQAAKSIEENGERALSLPTGVYYASGAQAGKVGVLFSGQGSQRLNMGADLAMAFEAAIGVWDELADLELEDNTALHQVVFPRPVFTPEEKAAQEERLTRTEWAQPALGATSAAMLAVLRQAGLKAEALGGHSFGEVTALYAAGAFDLETLVRIARKRGELMAQAAANRPGAMLAVGAPREEIEPLIGELLGEGAQVVVANHNSPRQVVLSGPTPQIEQLEQTLTAQKKSVKRLPVATAFHSPVVADAAAPFGDWLAGVEVGPLQVPVYANSTAAPYQDNVRETLAAQIAQPVRFVEQIRAMHQAGITTFVEVGAGNVLAKLTKEILKGEPVVALSLDVRGKHGLTSLWQGLGQLVVSGHTLNLAALWEEYESFVDPRTVKKPLMVLQLDGQNYDRQYPPPGGAAALPKPNPPRRPGDPLLPGLAPAAAASTAQAGAPASAALPGTAQAGTRAPATSAGAAQAGARAPAGAAGPGEAGARMAAPASAATAGARAPVASPASPISAAPVAARTQSPTQVGSTLMTQHNHFSPPAATPHPVQQPLPQAGSGLAALQHLQQQTTDVHIAYQRAMAEAHVAFLRAAETSTLTMAALLSGQPLPAPQVDAGVPVNLGAGATAPALPGQLAQAPALHAPVAQAPALHAPVSAAPAAAPLASMAQGAPAGSPATVAPSVAQPYAVPATGPVMEVAEAPVQAQPEQTRAPHGPKGNGHDQHETWATDQGFVQPPATEVASHGPAASAQGAVNALASVDLEKMLFEVVSDKTGYPTDILNLDMNLEADLGIDSIKRVEILSAIQDQFPNLPEVDASEIAALQTLREVLAFMEKYRSEIEAQGVVVDGDPASLQPAPASEAPRTTAEIMAARMGKLGGGAASSAPATTAGGEISPAMQKFLDADLQKMLFEVVADKTGYPQDILSLDMNLEADLGIDSIKRVEILSAIQDEAPDLPEVDAAEMAQLQTLGEVLAYMDKFRQAMKDGTLDQLLAEREAKAASAAAAAGAGSADATSAGANSVDATSVDATSADATSAQATSAQASSAAAASEQATSATSAHVPSPHATGTQPALPAAEQPTGVPVHPKHAAGALASSVPAAASQEDIPTAELLLSAVEEVEAEASGFAMACLVPGATVWITRDESGVAEALSARFNARGLHAHVVHTEPVHTEPVDTEPAGEERPDLLIDLGGLTDNVHVEAALAVHQRAFAWAKYMGPRLATGGGLVTVQDTGGDFGLAGRTGERAWLGGLSGLVKTARLEWLSACVKAIDLERGERTAAELAAALLSELLHGGPEVEVGLHADGRRTTLATRPLARANAQGGTGVELTPQDVVVVSGGARGVTAQAVLALARKTGARMVLLGRTELTEEPAAVAGATTDAEINRALLADAASRGEKLTPATLAPITKQILAVREIKATLAAVQAAGSEARYLPVSVTNATALAEALEQVRQSWGPITAVVHGAGVLQDKLIADKTPQQLELVMSTKVRGLHALLQATAQDPLKALCLYTSVAGRYGNRGQCDYAMANQILDTVAHREAIRRPGCVVKAINWGPWDGGMVTPALKKQLQRHGVPMIPQAAGAQLMTELLVSPGAVSVVAEAADAQGERFLDPSALDVTVGLWVTQDTHPYLAAHAIQDVPVVPVVMVLEWFTRAASATHPDLHVVATKDLRVLKGIRLTGYAQGPAVFRVTSKRVQNGAHRSLQLELCSLEGTLHYRATVELATGRAGKRFEATDLQLAPWPFSMREAYASKLFHRDAFQVLRTLEGVSPQGGTGTLVGATEMGWPGRWKTDPAALDGGLQLARLWGSVVTGKETLPTRVEEVLTYTDGPVTGPIQCVVLGREVTGTRTKLDVAFATGDGQLAAEMRGVEMHALP